MGYGGHAGGPVDAEADQTRRARLRRLSAMDPHAHPDLGTRWPPVGGKGALHFYRGRRTGTRRREHSEKAVPLGTYLLTAVGGKRGADHFVVLGESLGIRTVAQAGEQGSGPLDVSEEEGERFRGPSLTPAVSSAPTPLVGLWLIEEARGVLAVQGDLVTMPCRWQYGAVIIAEYRVSGRGQMALPAEARRRWDLDEGGSVEVADLGAAVLIVPAGRGGLRSMLNEAIEEAGGYSKLASQVAAEDPELA